MVKLDLSNRKLTEVPLIPNDITELYLFSNKIIEIKKGVFLQGLKFINLSFNKIKEIKESSFHLDYKYYFYVIFK